MKTYAALAITAVVCFGAVPAQAEPDYAAAVRADYHTNLRALFEDLHRNPELSFQETRTAAKLADELRKAGAEVTTGVGKTGVVGVMRNGKGPTVLIRADMDALPLEEKSGLPYASHVRQIGSDGVETPVMHACGHDAHVAALVGVAHRLAALKSRWRGTVVLVGQPAEESLGGAKAMMEDGLYTRFPKPDYALALHVNAYLPIGTIDGAEGIQSSSADNVEIVVHGIGAHGASPHKGRDPVYIGSQIVVALQSIESREISPFVPAVITVGSFHAGAKPNVISDEARLQLTLRSNDEATRNLLLTAVERVAKNTARALGVTEDKLPEVIHVEGTPTTVNDIALAKRLNGVMAATLGKEAVLPFRQRGMGAEDFAFFIEPRYGVPGYYFDVGATRREAIDRENAGGPPVPSHHSPEFKIDPEGAITTATIAMTAATLDLLSPTGASMGR